MAVSVEDLTLQVSKVKETAMSLEYNFNYDEIAVEHGFTDRHKAKSRTDEIKRLTLTLVTESASLKKMFLTLQTETQEMLLSEAVYNERLARERIDMKIMSFDELQAAREYRLAAEIIATIYS
jgi:hypothetical protein